MSDPRITRTEPATPRPAVATAPRPAAEARPTMAPDIATFGSNLAPPDARDALDKNGWWASTQTFFQGATRALAVTARTFVRLRAFSQLADVLDGNTQAIGKGVAGVTAAASTFFGRVVPSQAGRIMKVAGPLIKGGGHAVRAIGKAAPAFNVVAAVWDTYKAGTEQDPSKKAGAWANAGLSVGGTALALGSLALGATPVGWALGIGAAVVAGFQLVDNLSYEGKGTAWLGKTLSAL